jgi:hypothetical protein
VHYRVYRMQSKYSHASLWRRDVRLHTAGPATIIWAHARIPLKYASEGAEGYTLSACERRSIGSVFAVPQRCFQRTRSAVGKCEMSHHTYIPPFMNPRCARRRPPI